MSPYTLDNANKYSALTDTSHFANESTLGLRVIFHKEETKMRLIGWLAQGLQKSGSKGKRGRGYGKGSAATNPDKWKPRTSAQARRSSKTPRTWR